MTDTIRMKHFEILGKPLSVDEENRELTAIIATDGPNSHGLRFGVDSIDFDDFERAPVVLFGHDYDNPIGTVVGKVSVADGKATARVRFGVTDAALKAWKLAKDGFVRGWSLGLGYAEILGDRLLAPFAKELSLVVLPSNKQCVTMSDPGALAKGSMIGHDDARLLPGSLNKNIREQGFPAPEGYTAIFEALETDGDRVLQARFAKWVKTPTDSAPPASDERIAAVRKAVGDLDSRIAALGL